MVFRYSALPCGLPSVNAYIIIRQNAIEFLLVRIDIRNGPLVFQIRQIRQHFLRVSWRRGRVVGV